MNCTGICPLSELSYSASDKNFAQTSEDASGNEMLQASIGG
jgi:hypothetical protein